MLQRKKKAAKKSFRERVLAVVGRIPRGKVLTYKDVAMRAGSPRAYRAVGNVLSRNYNRKIPCHRVVCSDGEIGGYNRGVANKVRLLKKERFLR